MGRKQYGQEFKVEAVRLVRERTALGEDRAARSPKPEDRGGFWHGRREADPNETGDWGQNMRIAPVAEDRALQPKNGLRQNHL